MAEYIKDHLPISPKLAFGQDKIQVTTDPAVIGHINGSVNGSLGSGAYWILIWDEDPASGGTLRWNFVIEHNGTNDTPFGSDRLPENGIHCATEAWVSISTDPDSQSGSATADFTVGYQKA